MIPHIAWPPIDPPVPPPDPGTAFEDSAATDLAPLDGQDNAIIASQNIGYADLIAEISAIGDVDVTNQTGQVHADALEQSLAAVDLTHQIQTAAALEQSIATHAGTLDSKTPADTSLPDLPDAPGDPPVFSGDKPAPPPPPPPSGGGGHGGPVLNPCDPGFHFDIVFGDCVPDASNQPCSQQDLTFDPFTGTCNNIVIFGGGGLGSSTCDPFLGICPIII